MKLAPTLLLLVAFVGDVAAGRPLWSLEPPPEVATSAAAAPTTASTPRPSIYQTASTTATPWPDHTPPLTRRGADAQYELGTWTGLARGRSGLDGGLYVALKLARVRPSLTLAPYRVGVGLGVTVFPLLGLTGGLYYSADWRTGERAPGVYLALPRW